MKKLLIVLALVMSAQAVGAQMTLIPSSHPVYEDESRNGGHRVIVGYISNLDWDRAAAEQQARQGLKLPVINGGADIVDEGGVVYKNACSQEGLSRNHCVVLTGTKKYREDMLSIARNIISLGQQSSFPRFAGWIALAR